MIRLVSLAIQGFRSFTKDQVLRFPSTELGFYLMLGRNEQHPNLGANGSGKSSVWDALCWVFFGKTTRGLKGKEASNRGGEHLTSVCCEFYVGEKFCALTRTWSPNSLSLDEEGKEPRTVSQEEVDDLLGIKHDGFLQSVVIGQFSRLFFDLAPAEKLAVLSNFLGLQVWEKAAELARQRQSAMSEQTTELDLQLVAARSKAEVLEETLASLESRRRQQASERTKFLASLRTRLQEAERKREAARIEVDHKRSALDQLDVRSRKLHRKMIALDNKREAAKEAVLRKEAEVASATSVEEALVVSIEKLERLEGNCPLCFQEIREKHVHRVCGDLEEQLERAKEKRDALEDELSKLRRELGHLVDRLSDYNKRLEAIEELSTSSDDEMREVGADLRDATELVRTIEAQIAETEQSIETVLGAEIEATRASLKKMRSKEEFLFGEYRESKSALTIAQYWAARFKDVRLWIVEQALDELEVHVNNAMVDLGLEGFTISFDIERAKADGSGVVRGFQVLIREPGRPDPVLWESFSGGETQRLRMAAAAGIVDLIRARTSEFSLEVWDEPTAHLSQEGIEDLTAFLAARSRSRRRQVWLVDHRITNAGDFDDTLLIVKTEEGSEIKQPLQQNRVRINK